jgi:hypothetical protein
MTKRRVVQSMACVVIAFLSGGSDALDSAPATARSALAGRLIVGYQGWFGCPGDLDGNSDWQHWFVKGVRPEFLTVDALPSVRELEPQDLCDTGLRRADGSPVRLFSAQNPHVVSTHFRWMKEHGIDGAAMQRFVLALETAAKKRRSDNVVQNVRAAAQAHGRMFYLTYDVSGADPSTVVENIRNDWRHLVGTVRLTASPAYLHDRGKPVVQLWGFGFQDRPGTPDEVAKLIADLKLGRDGLPPATVIGGVPTHWRTLTGDSKADPGWAKVYRSYDVISPWSVGRFADEAGVDAFVRDQVQPDLLETRRLGLGYQPVIFPGFSWYNLMTNRGKPDNALLNRIPRRCGRFMWRQVFDLLDARVDTLYAAMFDEVDEATALFPLETRMDRLPVGASMVFLNQDGCALPDDWYLRVAGAAAGFVRSSTVPPKSLDDVIRP